MRGKDTGRTPLSAQGPRTRRAMSKPWRRIREALTGAGGWFVTAEPQPEVASVHDGELTAYLASAWRQWEEAGLPDDPGIDGGALSVPASGPVLRPPRTHRISITARAGQFAYDTMTLIGPGTCGEAARGAARPAVTAADVVLAGAAGRLRLHPPPRPPRHAHRLRRLVLP